MLVGAPKVCEVAGEANAIFNRIWPDLEAREDEAPGRTRPELWCEVTKPIKDELIDVGLRLMSRMHDDVTRGIIQER